MKTVNYPIKIPSGEYCWMFLNTEHQELCQFFDNEGGNSTCTLGFFDLEDAFGWVRKAPKCLALKEVNRP